jgi:hypothetical protein
MKTGRNAPCPCGSGKKYKNCCLSKEAETPWQQKLLMVVLVLILIGGVLAIFASIRSVEPGASSSSTAGKVWSEEHQHWH